MQKTTVDKGQQIQHLAKVFTPFEYLHTLSHYVNVFCAFSHMTEQCKVVHRGGADK